MPERQVAVVTGAGGALGLATSKLLLDRGYAVALAELDEGRLRSAEQQFADRAGQVLGIRTDVADAGSVQQLVEGVEERFGRLDVMVNNAGIIDPTSTDQVRLEDWHRLVGIHLTGAFLCSQASYEMMCRAGGGAIVNISSIAGNLGMPRRASYCASKAGIEGLTRSLAVEWARQRIRVNSVAPGYIRTFNHPTMFASGVISESRIKERTPLGDLGEPDDVAHAIAFLASPQAKYITGQTLIVDGGFSVQCSMDPVS